MNSGAEKRLLVTKAMDWRLCTHKQQLGSTTYAHAKGEWATAAGIGEAAVIKPHGDGWWSECGECECVDLQPEGERERETEADGQAGSQFPCVV